MEPRAHAPRSRFRILVWILGSLVAAVVVIVVLAVVFVQSSAFEDQVKARVLPRLSEELGREVTVQSVKATVFPRLGARVEGLRVAGTTERPLLLAGVSTARVAFWPFLFSAGKRIEIQAVELRDAELNLVRKSNGKYDFPRMSKRAPSRPLDVPSATIDNGTLRLIDPAQNREAVFTGIEGRASVKGQVLKVEKLEGHGYDGTIHLDGSRIDLSRPQPHWSIQWKVSGLELASLPSRPLDGTLGSDASLEGTGLEGQAVERTVTGTIGLDLRDADWERLNLEAAILSTVVRDLRAVGLLENPPKNMPQGTKLGDVKEELRVEDGWMTLERPLDVRTTFGKATITGRIAVDQRLDLEASTSLPPSLLAQLTNDKLQVGEPVPIVVQIGGTITRPQVTQVETDQLAALLVREGIRRLPEKVPELPFPIPKF